MLVENCWSTAYLKPLTLSHSPLLVNLFQCHSQHSSDNYPICNTNLILSQEHQSYGFKWWILDVQVYVQSTQNSGKIAPPSSEGSPWFQLARRTMLTFPSIHDDLVSIHHHVILLMFHPHLFLSSTLSTSISDCALTSTHTAYLSPALRKSLLISKPFSSSQFKILDLLTSLLQPIYFNSPLLLNDLFSASPNWVNF